MVQDKRASQRDKELFYKHNQSGKCNYCGLKLELDHKTPLANKGANRTSNYQLLCGPCNNRKGDMTDGEFRRTYQLTPAKQADGPPSKVIPQKYFEEIYALRELVTTLQGRMEAQDSELAAKNEQIRGLQVLLQQTQMPWWRVW